MGVMQQLVVQPHPVLWNGREDRQAELQPGESLYAFVRRHVPDLDLEQYEITIGDVVVRRDLWAHVSPKIGQRIEVRSAVGRSVVALIALAALTYFTMGAGATWAGALGATGWGATAVYAGAYFAGSVLINKFIAPKPGAPSIGAQADPTFNLAGTRNTFRPNEPAGLLFGRYKITPDLATDEPYTFYRGNDQYLAVMLSCGIGVDRIDALYQGDALLSSFDGVDVWYSGFPGMTESVIPLYSNTSTVAGGSLDSPAGTYIQRTSAADAIRLEVDLECDIFDYDSKGKPKYNSEGVTVQYRAVGAGSWLTFGSTVFSSSRPKRQRRTLFLDVTEGQYEVQVKRNNNASTGDAAHCEVTWAALRSVQKDTGNYKGLALIGAECKATGQLQGSLDQIRGVAYSVDLPYWNGSAWVTDGTHISNPGAQILKYARGYYDQDGKLIAGMGLDDSMIDMEAFKDFILHCQSKGYTYDYWLKERRNHKQVREAIAAAAFASTTWAGGKLSVVWADADQPLEGVVNMATIKKAQFQVDYALAGMADGIEGVYLDASDWTNKPISIAAPGVTTPQNPAQLALEGATDEAQAAKRLRYHLAQSIFQWKTVSFGTNIQHIGYGRMSLLALQHDLTGWGSGGRIQSATIDDDIITLKLDQPITAPESGDAFIGLRIPGEDGLRVFPLASFAGTTDTVELAEEWPEDAALPGATADNPAHDTIWMYDFTASPGKRVRVSQVEPEGDLKGAHVVAALEPEELWEYVETGTYTPPPASTVPTVRPVVSNVQVTEQVISQGGTAYSELHLTFNLAGRMDHALVFAQYTDTTDPDHPKTDGELRKVDETTNLEASFRIPGRGRYDIIVRPYGIDGFAGVSGSVTYDTENTDIEPPLFDSFSVSELPHGIRRFAWGYNAGTIPPPDLAGAVIRYALSTPSADPNATAWEDMTELGADGFHPQPFDSLLPPGNAPAWSNATTYAAGDFAMVDGTVYQSKSGGNLNHEPPNATYWDDVGAGLTYVFAARPRTANGIEPDEGDTRYAITLSASLPEVAVGAGEAADAAGVAAGLAQSAADAAQAAADAVDDAVTALQAQVDVLGAQVGDIMAADAWSSANAYASGEIVKDSGKLYRALQAVPAGTAITNTAYWELIGNYASLGEAVSATAHLATTTADDLGTLAETVDAQGVSIGDVEASIASEASTRASADSALSGRVSTVEARMPSGSGTLATSASVSDESSARVSADSALSGRIGVVEARMPTGTDTLANEARVVTAETAAASANSAMGSRVSAVEVRMPSGTGELATAAALSATTATVNTKPVVIIQDTAPGSTGRIEGDIWIDSANGNAMYIWWGGSWQTRRDNGKNHVYVQASEPNHALSNPGDVWIDTDDGNRVYTYDGSDYVDTGDTRIAASVARIDDLELTAGTHGEAIEALGLSVDGLTGAMEGYHLVQIDINGYVAGTYLYNDGTTSSFTVKSDVFGVVGTGNSLTWTNGVLSAVSGSNAFKTGAGFGSDSDPLILYYGPSGSDSTRTFASANVAISASGKAKLSGAGTNYAAGWQGAAITTSYNSSSPATVTFNVASGTFVTLGANVSYSAGSATVSQARNTTVRYYLYYNDPGLTGGGKTLQVDTDAYVTYSTPGFVLIGQVDVTIPASGSGSGDGGLTNCVSQDSYVLRRVGEYAVVSRAAEVREGDWLRVVDPATGAERWGRVSYAKRNRAACVRVETVEGMRLTCSTTAPLGTKGGQVLSPDALGVFLAQRIDGVFGHGECIAVHDAGEQWVMHITCENDFFLAGDDPRFLCAHHNLKAPLPD